jgi:hypothetical protein
MKAQKKSHRKPLERRPFTPVATRWDTQNSTSAWKGEQQNVSIFSTKGSTVSGNATLQSYADRGDFDGIVQDEHIAIQSSIQCP